MDCRQRRRQPRGLAIRRTHSRVHWLLYGHLYTTHCLFTSVRRERSTLQHGQTRQLRQHDSHVWFGDDKVTATRPLSNACQRLPPPGPQHRTGRGVGQRCDDAAVRAPFPFLSLALSLFPFLSLSPRLFPSLRRFHYRATALTATAHCPPTAAAYGILAVLA